MILNSIFAGISFFILANEIQKRVYRDNINYHIIIVSLLISFSFCIYHKHINTIQNNEAEKQWCMELVKFKKKKIGEK